MRSKYSLFHCKITLHVSGAFYTHRWTENQTQIHVVVYTSSASRNVEKLPGGIRSQATRQSRRHCLSLAAVLTLLLIGKLWARY
jgi:hypothetical protein